MSFDWVMIFRLVAAGFLGGLIGLEREFRAKEAGVRTHFIVALGSALFMVISEFAFDGKQHDAARVAAQVVSGIGFIGAGTIIVTRHQRIKGLTTAAGIWMTAGIGLAIGAGMYVVTGCALVLIWLLQYVIYRIPLGADSYDGYHLRFVIKADKDFEKVLRHQLDEWSAQITESTINWKRDDKVEFDCIILRADEIEYSEIKRFVGENESIIAFSYSPLRKHVQ